MKSTLTHEGLLESILEIEDEVDGIEPTNEDLRKVKVPNDKFELVWCGGSKSRGCGNMFSMFTAKYKGSYMICPPLW